MLFHFCFSQHPNHPQPIDVVEAKQNETKTNLSNNRRRPGCGGTGRRVGGSIRRHTEHNQPNPNTGGTAMRKRDWCSSALLYQRHNRRAVLLRQRDRRRLLL